LFGKPITKLTTFQLRAITYAKSFFAIFKNTRKEIPENVSRDPEMLIQFYEAQKEENKTSVRQRNDSDASGEGVFGATMEDIEQIKRSDQTAVSLTKEAKAAGGNLNMQDMMKIHGL
jgi:hypothetical protein